MPVGYLASTGGGLPPETPATIGWSPGTLSIRHPNGNVTLFDGNRDAEAINQALLAGGQALDYQGRPLRMFQMYGGWVGEDIDGGVPIPLNVIAGLGWAPGQQTAVQRYIQAGWRSGMGTLEREPPLLPPESIDAQTTGTLLEAYPRRFEWDPSQIVNDPGYKFALAEGERAVNRRAGANLMLLSGKTLRDLERFRTGLASSFANDYYERASRDFERDYNIYENTQAKRFNRLSTLAGYGPVAVNQVNTAGSNYGSNAANVLLGTGTANANLIQQAGNVRASQYANQGNILSSYDPYRTLADLYLLGRR